MKTSNHRRREMALAFSGEAELKTGREGVWDISAENSSSSSPSQTSSSLISVETHNE